MFRLIALMVFSRKKSWNEKKGAGITLIWVEDKLFISHFTYWLSQNNSEMVRALKLTTL